MSKFTLSGIILWLASFCLYGYQAIMSVLSKSAYVHDKAAAAAAGVRISLASAVGEQYFEWVDTIPWFYVHRAVSYVVTMQLFVLLFCLGALCLLIGIFRSD